MALGGGTYLVQNKILGGAYFKFKSVPNATANISERGDVAFAMELNWGLDDEIQVVDVKDLLADSVSLFAYSYSDDELLKLREIALHAKTIYLYRLNGGGAKATCAYGTARCAGVRGNDLKVVINTSVDDESYFDVQTYLGIELVDSQTVQGASELEDTDFITWNESAELAVTAGVALEGGANGVASTAKHQAFLNELENYPNVNAVGYDGTDEAVKSLYVNYVKRLRDEVGMRLQAVVYDKPADYEGVVNVVNGAEIVPWVLGVIGGTATNKSATNMTYDGELVVNTKYTQRQLEQCLKAGKFVLHKVGDDVNVLEDINSFTSITDEKGIIFQDNQTIRTLDTISDAIASVFASKYLGKVPNDEAGRVSLWLDVDRILQQMQDIRAIEFYNGEDDVTVAQGDAKKSVLITTAITVVNSMVRLYVDTTID